MAEQALSAQRKKRSAVSVFVRVRPLIASETSSTTLPGLILDSTDPAEESVAAFASGHTTVAGFAGILGQEADNGDVFERVVAPQLPTVLCGGTASLFCYGYTGSGKTHTVIGYGVERGLYFSAAERLLREVRGPSSESISGDGPASLFLQATACEIYNDTVFDLLGSEKLECQLLTDAEGQLQVLRRAEVETLVETFDMPALLEQLTEEQRHQMLTQAKDRFDESGMPSPLDGTLHSTAITKSEGLRSVSLSCPEDMEEISRGCVQQRAVGSSTEHEASSRSHAILRLEVVNVSMLEARRSLDQARVKLPALKNAIDNVTNVAAKLLFDGNRRMLRRQPWTSRGSLVEQEDKIWSPVDYDGWFIDDILIEDGSKKYRLEGIEGEARTAKAWAEELGAPDLYENSVFGKKSLDAPGLWESKHSALLAQKQAIEATRADVEADVVRARAVLADVMSRGPAALGGSLVMVDLAGADYDHRAGAQQKESAGINKSLFALKECLRALAGASTRPKYRDSKLTRLMEDNLAPAATSLRRCRESVSVMLVNVSPVEKLKKMTLNSLRYGQLYAQGTAASDVGRPAVGKLARPSATRTAAPPRAKGNNEAIALADPQVVEDIRAIYVTYCPEKTASDVDIILSTFKGRELILLGKVKAKYQEAMPAS